jgi:uncharacterized membrane protein YphA (DoxX/SURF4 family)
MSGCISGKKVPKLLVRISFGLSLAFTGIAHYRDAAMFAGMTKEGLGMLEPLATVWGYVLPALMIVGGVLFVVGIVPEIAVWVAGISLASIPAGVILKSAITGFSLGDSMPAAQNAFVWLIVYLLVSKSLFGGCCGTSCGDKTTKCACDPCGCGADCKCGKKEGHKNQ